MIFGSIACVPEAGSGGSADSNGNNQIAIVDASDSKIDVFGSPGEDGSGTAHDFEDGRAEHKVGVKVGEATWNASDWNIDNDADTGNGAVDAPAGYDP